jgi:hypothetical protein
MPFWCMCVRLTDNKYQPSAEDYQRESRIAVGISDEHKKIISDHQKGTGNSFYCKTHSDEYKERCKEAMIARHNYNKENNIVVSELTKQRMSAKKKMVYEAAGNPNFGKKMAGENLDA